MSDVASKKQSLPLISEPIPNYSFSELILHASHAEHANKHDKQVEIIKERGETRVQPCESTGDCHLPQIFPSDQYQVLGMAAWKDSLRGFIFFYK